MRHGKKVNHLGRQTAHRKAMLANMACSLIQHKRINTTVAKAKALKQFVEPMITKSKSDTTHNRRIVFSRLRQKEAVTEILLIRRNILNIRRILENHTKIIAKIQNLQRDKLIPNIDIKEHYDNLIDYSQNLWEISTNRKEIAELLNNTNESLINYKLNNIMKTLTIFSVIVFPLTLLAAIFGMNVTGGMPLLDSPFGFWQIMFSMIIGCMIMLFYFKRKKWL